MSGRASEPSSVLGRAFFFCRLTYSCFRIVKPHAHLAAFLRVLPPPLALAQATHGGASGKFTPWEGGHRVPAILSWPGTLVTDFSAAGVLGLGQGFGASSSLSAQPPLRSRSGGGGGLRLGGRSGGGRSDGRNGAGPGGIQRAGFGAGGATLAAVASHLDILPTLAAVAGVGLPADRAYDGINLAPLLFNVTMTARPAQLSFSKRRTPPSSESSGAAEAAEAEAAPSLEPEAGAATSRAALLTPSPAESLPFPSEPSATVAAVRALSPAKTLAALAARPLLHPGNENQTIAAVRVGDMKVHT